MHAMDLPLTDASGPKNNYTKNDRLHC